MPANYEQLRAWQVAHEVALLIFRETETWPKREWYGLAAHLRKTATSVPSNLAEGFRLGRDLGYLTEDRHAAIRTRMDELGKCLYGLVKSLGR